MKKTLPLVLIFFTVFSSVSAQNIKYKMSSYVDGSGGRDATTPLINFNLLNSQYFEITQASFTNLFQNAFDLLIGISIALTVVTFSVGAFNGLFSQEIGIGTKIKGKKMMQDSVLALIIVLSTWLIINTINPDLNRLPLFEILKNAEAKRAGANVTGIRAEGDANN